jgi:hypothetical protein
MKIGIKKVLLALCVGSMFLVVSAHASGRYRGRSGAACPEDKGKPPPCPVKKKKTEIRLDSTVCRMAMQQGPNCFYTIGYRSCATNGRLRGAARHSAHLCGKAADVRQGTCRLGVHHSAGSAPHQHFQPIGGCGR